MAAHGLQIALHLGELPLAPVDLGQFAMLTIYTARQRRVQAERQAARLPGRCKILKAFRLVQQRIGRSKALLGHSTIVQFCQVGVRAFPLFRGSVEKPGDLSIVAALESLARGMIGRSLVLILLETRLERFEVDRLPLRFRHIRQEGHGRRVLPFVRRGLDRCHARAIRASRSLTRWMAAVNAGGSGEIWGANSLAFKQAACASARFPTSSLACASVRRWPIILAASKAASCSVCRIFSSKSL